MLFPEQKMYVVTPDTYQISCWISQALYSMWNKMYVNDVVFSSITRPVKLIFHLMFRSGFILSPSQFLQIKFRAGTFWKSLLLGLVSRVVTQNKCYSPETGVTEGEHIGVDAGHELARARRNHGDSRGEERSETKGPPDPSFTTQSQQSTGKSKPRNQGSNNYLCLKVIFDTHSKIARYLIRNTSLFFFLS